MRVATKSEDPTARIPVITYHSIDNSGSVVSTAPEIFRQQMKKLSEAGYRTTTMAELTECVTSDRWPSEKTVVLTFDDGFENFLTIAAPLLREFSFNATVYLVTDHCGGFNDWGGNPSELPRSRLLSWSQVKELADEGIEFGSHTATHPDLTALDADAAEAEISRSKIAIEDAIGREVTSFAYPYGRNNGAVQRSVGKLYTSACSTNLGKVTRRSDRYRLERIDAYYLSNPASLAKLETQRMDAYLTVRQALRTVKSVVARG
ncbi:MAG TPA: polysaccharide deacetylase family protein [Pyrinomonadaceae bacterium]